MEEQIKDENIDYRKMYYRLAGAVESAIRLLVAAQQECEEILLEESAEENDSGGQ